MFDHDGVLVDSRDVFCREFIAACATHGRPDVTTATQVVALFDGNVYERMLALGMTRAQVKAIVGDTAGALAVATDLRPFPGAKELLSRLAARFEIVIVTSNAGHVVRGFLAQEGLAGHVADVLGAEADVSKVRKIGGVMARHPGQSRFFYVGDTRGDMQEGAHAGATPVGAAWGWHGADALAAAGAAFVAGTPAELLTYLLARAGDRPRGDGQRA
jgi:phosphoglycolate phosphatase